MFLSWLIILTLYGIIAGFHNIDPLAWLLLIPFFVQDTHDSIVKRREAARQSIEIFLEDIERNLKKD